METQSDRELGCDRENDATLLLCQRSVQDLDAARGVVPSISSKATKSRLVALGLSLCVAGAVLAYCSGASSFASRASETISNATTPIKLENGQTVTATPAAIVAALKGGRVFLIKSLTGAKLCVDDGGGTKADQTTLTMQPCDLSSPNQGFVYDKSTSQVKSKTKANLCIQVAFGNAMTLDMRLEQHEPEVHARRRGAEVLQH